MRLALALQDFSCAVSGLFFYEPTYAYIYIYMCVCVCVWTWSYTRIHQAKHSETD